MRSPFAEHQATAERVAIEYSEPHSHAGRGRYVHRDSAGAAEGFGGCGNHGIGSVDAAAHAPTTSGSTHPRSAVIPPTTTSERRKDAPPEGAFPSPARRREAIFARRTWATPRPGERARARHLGWGCASAGPVHQLSAITPADPHPDGRCARDRLESISSSLREHRRRLLGRAASRGTVVAERSTPSGAVERSSARRSSGRRARGKDARHR